MDLDLQTLGNTIVCLNTSNLMKMFVFPLSSEIHDYQSS